MSHCFVKEAENILDKEFKVLNRGFIRLVDYMGSDERIVPIAAASFENRILNGVSLSNEEIDKRIYWIG